MTSSQSSSILGRLQAAVSKQTGFTMKASSSLFFNGALNITFRLRPTEDQTKPSSLGLSSRHMDLRDLLVFEDRNRRQTEGGSWEYDELTAVLQSQIQQLSSAIKGDAGKEWWRTRGQLPWRQGATCTVASKWLPAHRPDFRLEMDIWPASHRSDSFELGTGNRADHPHFVTKRAFDGKGFQVDKISNGVASKQLTIQEMLHDALKKHDVDGQISGPTVTLHRREGLHRDTSMQVTFSEHSDPRRDYLTEIVDANALFIPGNEINGSDLNNAITRKAQAMFDRGVLEIKTLIAEGTPLSQVTSYRDEDEFCTVAFHCHDDHPDNRTVTIQLNTGGSRYDGGVRLYGGRKQENIVRMPSSLEEVGPTAH